MIPLPLTAWHCQSPLGRLEWCLLYLLSPAVLAAWLAWKRRRDGLVEAPTSARQSPPPPGTTDSPCRSNVLLSALAFSAFARVERLLGEETRAWQGNCGRDPDRLERALLLNLLDIARHLSPAGSFAALPAASTSMSAAFRGEIREWVRRGALWPPDDGPGSTVAAAWPSTAAAGTGTKDIEALETILSEGTARRHLEDLFLWSIRGRWAEGGVPRAEERLVAPAPSAPVTCATSSSGPPGGITAGGPVLWATRRARRGNAAKEVKWLLRWRADPNEVDQNGWTPLIWASHRNATDVLRLLIRGRADMDHIGREGSSALSIACRCAHIDVVKALLAAGASPFLVPVGNGNFDCHVGDDILSLLRERRRTATRSSTARRGRFSL
mmetsp:Transcript_97279/g.290589  ORF Transcript_97279/g.290589 Transcript_97279/m.290589 type:complete len:383 (-) Transcript_97279:64-1212(-)